MSKTRADRILDRLLAKLRLRVTEGTCDHRLCNGTGRWPDGGDCSDCDGTGNKLSLEEAE